DEQFTEEKTKISEEGVINFNSPEIQQKVIDKLNDLPTDLTVYFSLGKSDLEKQAMELLNCTAAMMTLFPELKILIRGHADQTGSLSFNQQLSYTRAQETMRYLVSRGIDANRVVLVEGFGSEKPSRLGSSEEVKSYNRRTELQFAM
ncbi:MAG: OOP family OmpA-OmpF porin, partial [Sphingobacteriales bacterium]